MLAQPSKQQSACWGWFRNSFDDDDSDINDDSDDDDIDDDADDGDNNDKSDDYYDKSDIVIMLMMKNMLVRSPHWWIQWQRW